MEESIKKQVQTKVARLKQTFNQPGQQALFKTLDVAEVMTNDVGIQTEDDLSVMKLREEMIVNADTFLVPSNSDYAFEHEEDVKPIEIVFDELVLEDICNSEGALDCREMIEIEADQLDLVGRSSENGLTRVRDPEPEELNAKENLTSPQYNKSVTFRKMQMQRNRKKTLATKMSAGKSPEPEQSPVGMLGGFFQFPDAKRNLFSEIEQQQKFKEETSKLTKDQLIDRLHKANDDHRKKVSQL